MANWFRQHETLTFHLATDGDGPVDAGAQRVR